MKTDAIRNREAGMSRIDKIKKLALWSKDPQGPNWLEGEGDNIQVADFITELVEDIPYLLERVRLMETVVTTTKGYFTCLKTPCDSTCKNAHRKAVYHSLAAYDSNRDEAGAGARKEK